MESQKRKPYPGIILAYQTFPHILFNPLSEYVNKAAALVIVLTPPVSKTKVDSFGAT